MGWELEDAAPAAAPAAAGQWALEAPPPEATAQPWWQRLGQGIEAGLAHRAAVERQNATSTGLGSWLGASLSLNPVLGPIIAAQRRARAGLGLDTAAERDAAATTAAVDKATAGMHDGIVGSIGYGLGESPEAMLAPQARLAGLGKGAMAAVARGAVNGALQGGYAAAKNDRNVAEGTAFGALGGGAIAPLTHIGGKIWNAARGVWEDAGTKAADTLAGRAGVNLSIGDLAPESGVRMAEDVAAFVPFTGAKSSRKAQAEALASIYQGLQDETRAPIATALDNGATPEELIARSAQHQLAEHNQAVQELSQAVPKDVTVAPKNFLPALRQYVTSWGDDLAGVKIPNEVRAVVGGLLDPPTALTDADRAAIQWANGNMDLAERLIPGISQRATPQTPDITADMAHTLQSELGAVERAFKRKAASGDQTERQTAAIGSLRKALLADMDETAAVSEPFRAMQAYFKQHVLPYREDPVLRDLVEPGATGEGVLGKLGNDDFAKARTLMAALDPDGQAALRFGALTKAGNAAVTDNLASGVSTAKLARAFDVGTEFGQKRQMAEIFTPSQQEKLTNLRDISQIARRASDWAHNPHTGVQNVGANLAKLGVAIGGGGALLGPLGALSPIPVGAAINKATRSAAGKALYFAKGGIGGADPVLRALAAQAAAGNAETRTPSIIDYLGM